METKPAVKYRDNLRFAVRAFGTAASNAMLMGTPVNNLVMDDLEAAYELIMQHDPRCVAPAEYRASRHD